MLYIDINHIIQLLRSGRSTPYIGILLTDAHTGITTGMHSLNSLSSTLNKFIGHVVEIDNPKDQALKRVNSHVVGAGDNPGRHSRFGPGTQ